MNKTPDLNDDLSDLLSSPVTPASERKQPPASYKPVNSYITEPCPKCHGTGRFIGYSGRDFGSCHACRGKGQRTFKSTREQRAKASEQRAVRKATSEADNVVEFSKAYPAVWAWIDGNVNFEFAASMRAAVAKYGYLTEKQMAACERLSAKDVARKAEDVARIEAAPAADSAGIDRLKAAFDKAAAHTAAKARGLTVRNPKITIGGMTISPAKANSKNPGALYVKESGNYLGKIADGKFIASRDCTPEQQTQVLAFIADPAQAAKVYGQETGTCCICNAELRSEWRLRGIGPICAEKFGW